MPTQSLQKALLPGRDELSLQSSSHGPIGEPGRSRYAVQFRRHCHQLVATGYQRICSEGHCESEEDFITQRLVEEIKQAQLDRSLPRWAKRYFVTDQAPVSVPNRHGKSRPQIDIAVESAQSRERPTFHFEAKRLRIDDSHSVSEYVGPKGVGCFVAELYARSGTEGGMLGYVQSESPQYWANRIDRKFRRGSKRKHRLTKDGVWTLNRLLPSLEHTYCTRHNRPTLGVITIYHTLLDFQVANPRHGRSAAQT